MWGWILKGASYLISFVNFIPSLLKLYYEIKKVFQANKEKAARGERDQVREDHNATKDKWRERAQQEGENLHD